MNISADYAGSTDNITQQLNVRLLDWVLIYGLMERRETSGFTKITDTIKGRDGVYGEKEVILLSVFRGKKCIDPLKPHHGRDAQKKKFKSSSSPIFFSSLHPVFLPQGVGSALTLKTSSG